MEITLHYGLPVLMEAERGSEGNNLLGDGYFLFQLENKKGIKRKLEMILGDIVLVVNGGGFEIFLDVC